MARLNEPPPPIESIDALKRRFIRQNREIARVNSTQSLRIRNLETEISRLLAENIAIREQAINSAQEAERLRHSHRVFKDVSRLKEQLESKLSEVGALLTELGGLPDKAKRRLSHQQRRRSGLVDVVTSPDQKEWKNRQAIGGVVPGERLVQEGRLPVIVEGKHYPRKTLEPLEIRGLMGDETGASDSPELGPPPVAHFDVAEPINFAAPPPSGDALSRAGDSFQDLGDEVKPLPDNLERRRRRRASALLEDMPTFIGSATDVSHTAEQNMSLKAGAKRKLDVREDGYMHESRLSEPDEFAFQRKAIASDVPQPRPKGSRFTKPGTISLAGVLKEQDPATRVDPVARKVLGPKSTNSPSKSRRAGNGGDKMLPAKEEMIVRNKTVEQVEHSRKRPVTANSSMNDCKSVEQQIGISSESNGIEPPPKTPAGLDPFSPMSTEPSARTGQQTEMALTASVEDVLGGTDGRASRRARGAVSYAEPSLRVKMRRPTKELVPAVGEHTNSLKAPRRESGSRSESHERQSSLDLGAIKIRTVTIKRETPDDEAQCWRGTQETREEPASPLVDKMAKASSKVTAREEETQAEEPLSDIGATQLPEARLDGLSIFDGPNSSPHDSPDTIIIQSKTASRRHSSNPASSRRVGQEFTKSTISSEQPQPRNSPVLARDRPPRPGSAASLRKESLNREDKLNLRRVASVATLNSGMATKMDSGSTVPGTATGVGRTERAAARRRSMMV